MVVFIMGSVEVLVGVGWWVDVVVTLPQEDVSEKGLVNKT